jgi:hypothetical protein
MRCARPALRLSFLLAALALPGCGSDLSSTTCPDECALAHAALDRHAHDDCTGVTLGPCDLPGYNGGPNAVLCPADAGTFCDPYVCRADIKSALEEQGCPGW